MPSRSTADAIDARLLLALNADPRAATVALAEQTGVSRNTAQARLARWSETGALARFERTVTPDFLGYPLRAFVLTNVKQRLLREVAAALAEVPEIVEVHGLSGVADLLVQVVARDADDLYRIAGQILGIRGVKRTNTALVMRNLVDFRLTPLIERLAADG
ncbi:AsnC family transcriptional regulator [Mycolicibacter heraklionensis]|uniref:AsnC family transcriptional regulator n=1 Tax=Mycolicibacter heraklionensis TaxID=512402 RepID=A0ABR5FJY5_9MYCO|nr:Lrp/AsnC family transcriptional regulator [Mycolicibacter heraklionensis]KLO31354.1 AsnC family transcriptional regulator [Mycolicibacter heraklionensis]